MGNKKLKNEISLFLLLILALLIFIFSFYILGFNREINYHYFKTSLIQSIGYKFVPKTITLMFVGDIMLDRGVKWSIEKYGDNDWKFPFLEIAEYLQEADILFGNLESQISDKGIKVGSIYSFRAKPESLEGLIYAGFDVLSVANNHVFDYGREAMEDSFSNLKKAGISYVGGGFSSIEAHSPIIKEINDTTIAFLAYTNLGTPYWKATEGYSGIAWLDEEITKDIKLAKEKANVIIVSMHFGEEYRTKPNIEQKYLARLAIDSGADLVIGHHPHIAQEVERYKLGYIAYSLGNFIFDQGFSESTMEGLILKVLLKNGRIKEVVPLKIKINKFFQPIIAKD